jgi:hypothetical protein
LVCAIAREGEFAYEGHAGIQPPGELPAHQRGSLQSDEAHCRFGLPAAVSINLMRAAGRPALLPWNATSHSDRHGHGYPPALATQHFGGADLAAALHR